MSPERRSARRAAFTLVELLVVIAVIAILAAMLMPALNAALDKAHETRTMSLIHNAEMAAEQFANDYGDYPPSTWDEYFELFEYDWNQDGTYQGSDAGDPDEPDYTVFGTDPRDHNQTIEVFLACVATGAGGPYMEPGEDQLGNTDGDTDASVDLGGDPDPEQPVADASNWYFGGNELFELVDWWGNPLMYVHNRDYAAADGYLDGANVWDDPTDGSGEFSRYKDAEGDDWPCYARSRFGTKTLNPPNLSTFQLYSWGKDLAPGRSYGNQDNFLYPGWTAGDGTLPGSAPQNLEGVGGVQWEPGDGNLANWEE